ncbi:AbrB/MazE/SpoVT family DNA-binding domain-containing protein [Sphingomonas sp. 7/4-4]|jgi:AbrB family looped-hinge helix DNA binding protein|uniref:AbrB/MazE/SpoVT family DNA-binding domain-containing protein n=1 Tax=Sphingomonas sp. 7/4-4 TaxID=3018446 RepID=UPI0022F3D460|nr:AbrB/MazE/SpoVT family DNA-binding domain-containing protein [Sphingomonas sp. 7/4-4]WBY09002.1 AbrB/MazE/SpoVT family DNA-binding domain-containing protein [Sphingomonas sp. 7/4-4]
MSKLTVTAKGQVTLRKDLLQHLGVRPGQQIDVEKLPDGRIEVRAVSARHDISEVFGLLKRRHGPVLSIEEIAAATIQGWSGEK